MRRMKRQFRALQDAIQEGAELEQVPLLYLAFPSPSNTFVLCSARALSVARKVYDWQYAVLGRAWSNVAFDHET